MEAECNLGEKDVLVLGDGNLSYGAYLANEIKWSLSASLTVTCLESHQDLLKKYPQCDKNIENIKKSRHRVIFQVDATNLSATFSPSDKFDCIIFNFPHVGGKSNLKKNRNLLLRFFESAVTCLRSIGDSRIIVSLCAGQGGTEYEGIHRHPQAADSWQIVEMAARSDLILTHVLPFSMSNNYRCVGFRSQNKPFTLSNSLTHIFLWSKAVSVPQRCVTSTADAAYVGLNQYSQQLIIDMANRVCLRQVVSDLTDKSVSSILSTPPIVLLRPYQKYNDPFPLFINVQSNQINGLSHSNGCGGGGGGDIIPMDELQKRLLGWEIVANELIDNHQFYYFYSKPSDALNTLMKSISSLVENENNLQKLITTSSSRWVLSGLIDAKTNQLRPQLIQLRPGLIKKSFMEQLQRCWQGIKFETIIDKDHVCILSTGEEDGGDKEEGLLCIETFTHYLHSDSNVYTIDWIDLINCATVRWNLTNENNRLNDLLLCENVSLLVNNSTTTTTTTSTTTNTKPTVICRSICPSLHVQDMSFWLSKAQINYITNFDKFENFLTIRINLIAAAFAMESLLSVILIDKYYSNMDFVAIYPQRYLSLCYRLTFQHLDRALDQITVNRIQNHIRLAIRDILSVELR